MEENFSTNSSNLMMENPATINETYHQISSPNNNVNIHNNNSNIKNSHEKDLENEVIYFSINQDSKLVKI